MKLAVVAMDLEDIPQVLDVDRESYSVPWPASAYRREVLHNRNARYIVLREWPEGGAAPNSSELPPRPRLPFPFFRRQARAEEKLNNKGPIVGYAGMWMMIDEAHITTIAIRKEWRGHGFGELLLASLIESAAEISAQRLTLEVRRSNETAQNLYRKYGFRQEGVRPRYYSDDNEDAYIMTTGSIQTEEYQERFETLVRALNERLQNAQDTLVTTSHFHIRKPAGARSADESC